MATFIAVPERTKDGRTRTGYPTCAAKRSATVVLVAETQEGGSRWRCWSMAECVARFSALADAEEVEEERRRRRGMTEKMIRKQLNQPPSIYIYLYNSQWYQMACLYRLQTVYSVQCTVFFYY